MLGYIVEINLKQKELKFQRRQFIPSQLFLAPQSVTQTFCWDDRRMDLKAALAVAAEAMHEDVKQMLIDILEHSNRELE